MTYAHNLYGLKLESDFDVLALDSWQGAQDARADIMVRLGQVPSRLEAPDHIAPIFQTRGRDEYLLTLPGSGRFLVRNGHEVTVETEAGADLAHIGALVAGPIQAVLWHQRGLLPLHASVVTVNGQTIALAGPVAAGKSTIAALLAARGHHVMADDVCVVDASARNDVLVMPGVLRMRLWRDALDHLGIRSEGLQRVQPHKEQFFVDPHGGVADAQKLSAVVVLVRRFNNPLAVDLLRGIGAIQALLHIVHMQRVARALGRDSEIFSALTRLAAGVAVWRLRVPDNLTRLGDIADKALTVLEA
jgi:hypothetical protein